MPTQDEYVYEFFRKNSIDNINDLWLWAVINGDGRHLETGKIHLQPIIDELLPWFVANYNSKTPEKLIESTVYTCIHNM